MLLTEKTKQNKNNKTKINRRKTEKQNHLIDKAYNDLIL